MTVSQIRCTMFTSNLYVLEDSTSNDIWLVDCGDGVLIIPIGKCVKGVFITHSHIDHIIGLNKLLGKFPKVKVLCSEFAKNGLYDVKLNLSFYHETPFVFNGKNVIVINNGDSFELYPNHVIKVFATPGHNLGCLSYKIDNYIFTGDSLVPGFPVVTKLKGGNKEQSAASLVMLESMITKNTFICGGHEDIMLIK